MLEFDFKATVGGFDLHAVSGAAASRMGLFGPSGCGKSTLLNCLAGVVRPREGYIRLNGRVLFDAAGKRNVPPHKRAIGCVFQGGRLFPHMTVRANIEYGRGKASHGPDLAELAGVFDLAELLDRMGGELSGGERQRVALARALACGPKLLLLDEPLEAVDHAARLRILSYVKGAHERWQLPFVYVSHSLSEVLFLAEKAWHMSRGRIERSVHPRDLLVCADARVDPVSNIISGVVAENPAHTGHAKVRCDRQEFRVPSDGLTVGQAVTMSLPARDIMLSVGRPQGLSARNTFPATIEKIEQDDHAWWITVDAGGNRLVAELTEGAVRELKLRVGGQVYVVIKAHAITAAAAGEVAP